MLNHTILTYTGSFHELRGLHSGAPTAWRPPSATAAASGARADGRFAERQQESVTSRIAVWSLLKYHTTSRFSKLNICVCVCVCINICIYIYIYIHIYTYTHIHIHTYTYTYMHIDIMTINSPCYHYLDHMHTCMYVCIYIYIHNYICI